MREIPVRKALVPLLRRWRGEDEAAGVEHVVHWRGRQVRTVHRAWHAALRRADVRQELSPYSLRHAYATYSAANGAPLKSLSALMGHRDATMILKVYQHALEHQGARTVEMMPDVLKLGTGDDPVPPGEPCRLFPTWRFGAFPRCLSGRGSDEKALTPGFRPATMPSFFNKHLRSETCPPNIGTGNERLKAAADDIYQQLADNPGIGIPVDPDMIDFLGLTEAPPAWKKAMGASFCRSTKTESLERFNLKK